MVQTLRSLGNVLKLLYEHYVSLLSSWTNTIEAIIPLSHSTFISGSQTSHAPRTAAKQKAFAVT